MGSLTLTNATIPLTIWIIIHSPCITSASNLFPNKPPDTIMSDCFKEVFCNVIGKLFDIVNIAQTSLYHTKRFGYTTVSTTFQQYTYENKEVHRVILVDWNEDVSDHQEIKLVSAH